MNQRTVVMLKPDVTDSLREVLQILNMLPRSPKLLASRLHLFSQNEVRAFYDEHVGKPYYEAHENFMLSGPTLLLLLDGYNIIKETRSIVGPTDPEQARLVAPYTIRAKYGTVLPRNAIHASDSAAAAEREARVLGLAPWKEST